MKSFANVRKLWKQRPFEPFRIVLDSGQHYDILGPIATPKIEDDKEPDGLHLVSILHVTALEVIQTKAKRK